MHHTADGQSDSYFILFIKMEINVNQISEKIEMRYQDEIASNNPDDPISVIYTHNYKLHYRTIDTILDISFD